VKGEFRVLGINRPEGERSGKKRGRKTHHIGCRPGGKGKTKSRSCRYCPRLTGETGKDATGAKECGPFLVAARETSSFATEGTSSVIGREVKVVPQVQSKWVNRPWKRGEEPGRKKICERSRVLGFALAGGPHLLCHGREQGGESSSLRA